MKNGGSNYDSLEVVGVTMSQVNCVRLRRGVMRIDQDAP
jgi:hypothetical protein